MDDIERWLKPDYPFDDNYKFRKELPSVMTQKNESCNLWSILKSNIGKDLSKTVMPIQLNEPISFLQRICEYMEYSNLLFQACLENDALIRLELITAFIISAVSSSNKRCGKPFNPLLGETYELDRRADRGYIFISEQVSHHPPISAFHVIADPYFRITGNLHPKIKFLGTSLEINPKGNIYLELLQVKETYVWQNVPSFINNILVGKVNISYEGETKINCSNGKMKSIIKWKTSSNTIFAKSNGSSSSATSNTLEESNCSSNDNSNNNHSDNTSSNDVTNQVVAYLYEDKSNIKPSRVIYGRWSDALFSVSAPIWEKHCENRKGWRHQLSESPLGNVVSKFSGNSRGSLRFFHSSSYFLSSQSPSSLEIPELSPTECSTYSPQLDRRKTYYSSSKQSSTINSNSSYNSSNNVFSSGGIYDNDLDLNLPLQTCLWRASARPDKSVLFYNFSYFTILLMDKSNSQLPSTDSRYRPDISMMDLGKIDEAGEEKSRLEEKQRKRRKQLKKNKLNGDNVALWFDLKENSDSEWIFNEKYLQRNWELCPDLF